MTLTADLYLTLHDVEDLDINRAARLPTDPADSDTAAQHLSKGRRCTASDGRPATDKCTEGRCQGRATRRARQEDYSNRPTYCGMRDHDQLDAERCRSGSPTVHRQRFGLGT